MSNDELEVLTWRELATPYARDLWTLRAKYDYLSYEEKLLLHYTQGAPHPHDLRYALELWEETD